MNETDIREPTFYFEEGLQGILEYKPKEWIIPKLLPQGACIVGVVGASGSGKSCFVYDILMNYLTGTTQWFNLRMKGEDRNCVLLASEGDYRRRLKGWLLEHGIADSEQAQTEGRLLILDPSKCHGGISITGNNIDTLIEDIERSVSSVGLIVIDTLNGFYNGSENDNSDMGIFLRNINRLSQEFQACVILIHHTGKDGRRAYDTDTDTSGRGASSFNAKLDMNIYVSGKPLTGITVRTTKARDSIEGFCFKLKGKIVPVAPCVDGEDPETTVVLESLEPLTAIPNRPKEDTDITMIQEGISEGILPVYEGFVSREDLNRFFTTHGGKDGTGFKGKGVYQQSDPTKTGICGRLSRKGCLEWIAEREGYLLTDTDSYCWNT